MIYENDYELIYMTRQKDEHAFRMLVEKYEDTIRSIIYRYQKQKDRIWNQDDFKQLAMLKLLQAIDYYCEDCKVPFAPFYFEIFRRAMVDHYRERISYKGGCDFYSISIDAEIFDGGSRYEYVNYQTNREKDISTALYDRIYQAKQSLSPLECRIIDLRGQGYTYAQISSMLTIKKKKVDNTLQKVRKSKRKKR